MFRMVSQHLKKVYYAGKPMEGAVCYSNNIDFNYPWAYRCNQRHRKSLTNPSCAQGSEPNERFYFHTSVNHCDKVNFKAEQHISHQNCSFKNQEEVLNLRNGCLKRGYEQYII